MRLTVLLAACTLLTCTACTHRRGNKDFTFGGGMPGGEVGVGLPSLGSGISSEDLDGRTRSNDMAPEAVITTMMEDFQRVHFGYDAYTLDENSIQALSRNASLMQTWGGVEVEVQGHSDDRGSTEYNLALGQRRAAAVREAMIGMGVAPSRVATVSFGEEQPLQHAGGETAWAQNRRAEFRVTNGDGQVQGTVE